jgi:hypothetical protein
VIPWKLVFEVGNDTEWDSIYHALCSGYFLCSSKELFIVYPNPVFKFHMPIALTVPPSLVPQPMNIVHQTFFGKTLGRIGVPQWPPQLFVKYSLSLGD